VSGGLTFKGPYYRYMAPSTDPSEPGCDSS
jgi:hypothetical protein